MRSDRAEPVRKEAPVVEGALRGVITSKQKPKDTPPQEIGG